MGCICSCMKKKRSKAGEGQRKTRRRVSFLSSIPPDLLEGTAPTTSDEHSSGPGLTPEPTSTVGSHSGWTRFLSRLDRHHKYSPEVIPVVPQPFQDHSSPRPQSPDSDAQGQILPGSQSDTGTECRDLVNLEALGLPNIGNSCFLNATLQCLLVLPVFLQEIHRQRIENLSWLSSCYNLHSCLSEVHYSCQPGSGATEEYKEQILRTVKYLLACQDRKYLQDSQQDAHELLVNMLCLLRVEGRVLVELNQGYISPVSHLEFLMASVLSCTSCGRTSSNSEDYNHLSLDISPEGTLQDCLALNFKSCVVDFRCPNCDGLQASRREQFHTLPRVLVLHLKRFRHRRWGVQKLKRSLLIPPKLSLSTLCGDDVPPLHSVIPEEQAFTNLDSNNDSALSPPVPDNDSALSPPVPDHDSALSPPVPDDDSALSPPVPDDDSALSPPVPDDDSALSPPVPDDDSALSPPEPDDDGALSPPVLDDDSAFSPPVPDDDSALSSSGLHDQDPGKVKQGVTVEDPVTSSGYYQLTGILSHLGGFMLSGHYVSDIRAANGKWLRCNDSMVSVSSEASVLRSRARSAYLLFYVYR
ncbi:hypothetical protein DPEC_G00324740 [Dallia pectoralis]|uniref:Uncharacterized protein n=1 Tax=Dallia pectoralis TaxID=75939 RepID=A0ACC2FAX4_DALPE|nr:hypothetical protein DPEC_G00324740 [Dallia pectoralis]